MLKNEYIDNGDGTMYVLLNGKKGYISGFSLIDKEDFEIVNPFSWSLGHGYACGYDQPNKKMIRMNRLILGYPKGISDHINRNKLDNRKINLREASSRLNAINKGIQSNNRLGFMGVTKVNSKYRAVINNNGKYTHLGVFTTPEELHSVYLKAKAILLQQQGV